MTYFAIPARAGSKGFENKNRVLWESTFAGIPESWKSRTILSTDDSLLANRASGINVHLRPDELCTDTASMKDVLICIAEAYGMKSCDTIVLLYLTYPERTTAHVKDAMRFYETSVHNTLLCKKKPLTHPYMCITDDNKQLIKHDLYRRQDYPVVWEISHFIGIFMVGELKKLNKNLYNDETGFMEIAHYVDVDYPDDIDRLAI